MVAVSAVVPAYNEEKYIGQVLDIIVKIPELTEIIVVNDGSTITQLLLLSLIPLN